MRLSNKKQKSEALHQQARDQEPKASSSPVINHFRLLSDEMVLYILRLLPKKDLVTVSMLNKKFRDLSRDDSLWTELTLDYKDVKQSAESCRKLVERCKKLTSLKITNKSYNNGSLNIMSVVIRAKKCLKILDIDNSINKWTDVALEKLSQMTKLENVNVTFTNSYLQNGLQQLAKLDQLEVLSVRMRVEEGLWSMLSKELTKIKKLKECNMEIQQSDDPNHVVAAKLVIERPDYD